MNNISKSTDYAIQILLLIARHRFMAMNQIADAMGLSPQYITKLVQPLVRAGLLISKRGCYGGVALGMKSSEINLYDVVSTVEGPTDYEKTGNGKNLTEVYKMLRKSYEDDLKAITIDLLLEEPQESSEETAE